MSKQDKTNTGEDLRQHMKSLLMRESLIDKDLIESTDRSATPVFRMLPDACVVKVGGHSVLDQGKDVVYPLVESLSKALDTRKLIIGTGGGARTRHVFSIGLDLGLPTGVLASLSIADALGNAHILGTLLAPHGVVAIPPEIFGHLLPFFIKSAPGVIFSGQPPYALWEHPPAVGRIPPHRTDAGSYLTAECFGCKTFTLIKDVDGLYDADPRRVPEAKLIKKIGVSELRERKLDTLPFDPVMLDLLDRSRLVRQFQIINGKRPELLEPALDGEHVGTIVHAD